MPASAATAAATHAAAYRHCAALAAARGDRYMVRAHTMVAERYERRAAEAAEPEITLAEALAPYPSALQLVQH